MMIEPLDRFHLARLELQPRQEFMRPMITGAYARELMKAGPAFAVVDGVRVLACCGVVTIWNGVGHAWAMLSGDVGARGLLFVTRCSRAFFDGCDYHRVQTHVDCDFHNGCDWAKLLGFKNEGRMERYGPDGRDCFMFARVRG